MTGNHLHDKLNNNDLSAVLNFFASTQNVPLKVKLAKGVDDHGRTPLALLSAQANIHSHALTSTAVNLVHYNPEGLTSKDEHNNTPLIIARESRACAKIISLLSLTPQAARSLGLEGLRSEYAPFLNFWNELMGLIAKRKFEDCHTFFDRHDDDLVLEVLRYRWSGAAHQVSCVSQNFSDSLVFLALRMVYRHPPSLNDGNPHAGNKTLLQLAKNSMVNGCQEIKSVFSLKEKKVTHTPFPTLLHDYLPAKYHEIYGSYNTVCQFIKHMKYDKAELVELEAVLNPARRCDVCSSLGAKPCARCKCTFYCSTKCQTVAWKKHKKTCKAPTRPPATQAELRSLHKGIALLNMCIQRSGAGDGPTSVVVGFLLPGPAY